MLGSKLTFVSLVTIQLLLVLTHSGKAKSSMRKPKFISFDTKSGQIDINLDLSVPFLSIPLDDKMSDSTTPSPLVNINTRALAIFGTIMTFSAFVVPLLVKKVPEAPVQPVAGSYHYGYGKEHKRSDRGSDHWYFGDSLNEILFHDSLVTPCVQRVICSAVAKAASSTDNPTSLDKIIDGLSSHSLFNHVVNGTVIKEAILKGREVTEIDDCTATYEGCALSQQIIGNVLKVIGI